MQAVTVPIYINESYDEFALTNATVNLPAGEHRLRLALSGYFNLDYIEFEALSSVLRLPGAASDPRDLDGDGRYEDVNGNGRRDFADVVLFFNQMAWIASNDNGRRVRLQCQRSVRLRRRHDPLRGPVITRP